MKPAPFAYHRAHSVAEAVALLAELGDEAKILAGGLSLVPIPSRPPVSSRGTTGTAPGGTAPGGAAPGGAA